MKTQKIPRKLIEKERTRMSKRQKKALAEKNWVGKGTLRPGVTFDNKRIKPVRPNIDQLYRSGKLDD